MPASTHAPTDLNTFYNSKMAYDEWMLKAGAATTWDEGSMSNVMPPTAELKMAWDSLSAADKTITYGGRINKQKLAVPPLYTIVRT
jgi:hypothetical protein